MGDTMRTLPMRDLLRRMLGEYLGDKSVFGLRESTWYRKRDARTIAILGEESETVLGPAAGPHTQLAQNIVAAYLTGSRCIELKTVQILDQLEIEKPCINVADEGYNTEWSTELSLQEAWEEYAKAWILLHLTEELWDLRASGNDRSFIFTMSVGYDLEGIRNDRMQQFIDRMIDSSGEQKFQRWIAELEATVPPLLAGTPLEHKIASVRPLCERISGAMCKTVTLSTMHGCPPEEIESICRYLLTEKKLDTFVKLNPTLLGFETVRDTLDRLGYRYVTLDRDGFRHDLQYDPAIAILRNLREAAERSGRRFGVKLTNTLATVNREEPVGLPLPGDQAYLSGRALYPLSITLAARLSREFEGLLPISYSGGITAHNVAAVFRAGIRPITTCTVLLKPGGYTRQVQLARTIDDIEVWDRRKIDVDALTALAESALADRTLHKQFRGSDEVAVPGELPPYDCYRAPCIVACPIGQHVPEYIRLVGERRYGEALELIYEQNALPGITGHICDHQCQHACTRLDYEGCINIRELKKIAVQQGTEELSRTRAAEPKPDVPTRSTQCAVIGAGPAGLAAAYFLKREGFSVTVFEREENAGGVVRNVIPSFRLPVEAIEQDIEHIASCGVEFRFGVSPEPTADALRNEGYGPIVLAIGAEVDNELPIDGDRTRVIKSLEFLWTFRGNIRDGVSQRHKKPGRNVVVVGGGNTAMDAARAAITLPDVENVTVLYRRSEAEMPADREEYENALADGVVFRFLRNPESITDDGLLTVRVMELGEPDTSGRRRPLATERTESFTANTIIAAIGEKVDRETLRRFGVPLDEPLARPETLETALPKVYLAGDALTGPSTVVRCIAAGRRAADAITHDHGGSVRQIPAPCVRSAQRSVNRRFVEELLPRKSTVLGKPDPRGYTDHREFAAREYDRCLQCSYLCNRCVEVCPNRANITVSTMADPLFRDPFQIVHLDALCNECGNCAQFCPWSERVPYRDKPTVFSAADDFETSTNEGWLLSVDGKTLRTRIGNEVRDLRPTSDGGWTASSNTASPDTSEARFYRLLDILWRERPELFARLDGRR